MAGGISKTGQEAAEMKLLMPGTNSIEEQWAKEQEDQIHNAEMRNVEKSLPLSSNQAKN